MLSVTPYKNIEDFALTLAWVACKNVVVFFIMDFGRVLCVCVKKVVQKYACEAYIIGYNVS